VPYAWRVQAISALAIFLASPALAQQQRPAPPQPAQPPAQPAQKPVTWETLPRMQLEQLFAGPLKDTVIQRWRDPQTGIVCYVYLPFTVQNTPLATGGVQYAANSIGSIGCVEPAAAAPKVASPPPPPPPSPSARKPAAQPAARAPAAASGEQPAQQ
jgi:hypothetical protein